MLFSQRFDRYILRPSGICRTREPSRGFNKGHSLNFLEGSRVRQTPEEGQRTYRPKRCENNNKDEDNSPKTLNDKKLYTAIYNLEDIQFRDHENQKF